MADGWPHACHVGPLLSNGGPYHANKGFTVGKPTHWRDCAGVSWMQFILNVDELIWPKAFGLSAKPLALELRPPGRRPTGR